MVIHLLETYPLTRSFLTELFSEKKYKKKIEITQTAEKSDIMFSDERYFYHKNLETGIFLLPGDTAVINPVKAKSTLFCGMHRTDAVTFSSIGDDRALICLQKETEVCGMKITPFETFVPFDRNRSITKNLVAGFIVTVADIYFGEEKWKRNFI